MRDTHHKEQRFSLNTFSAPARVCVCVCVGVIDAGWDLNRNTIARQRNQIILPFNFDKSDLIRRQAIGFSGR